MLFDTSSDEVVDAREDNNAVVLLILEKLGLVEESEEHSKHRMVQDIERNVCDCHKVNDGLVGCCETA